MAANVDLLNITTPLGQQAFVLVSIEGEGKISAPFEYRAVLRSGLSAIEVDQILYHPVTVTMSQGGVHKCYLNGLVSHIEQTPANAVGSALLGPQSYWDYELAIAPKLSFLDQTTDCRFFENKNALDIAKTVLSQFGITDTDTDTDTDFRTSGNPPVRPYTVMFNETYLDFFQRILVSHSYGCLFSRARSRAR